MPDITYDAIKPLIHSEEQHGSAVEVVFRCPESGVEVTASAGIKAGAGLKATAVKSVKRTDAGGTRRHRAEVQAQSRMLRCQTVRVALIQPLRATPG